MASSISSSKKFLPKKIKRNLKTVLVHFCPTALASAIVEISKINSDTNCSNITREERLHLVQVLKDLRIQVAGLLGTDKAIITSGGVALSEVDFRTMQSRLYPNLHLVGDILD